MHTEQRRIAYIDSAKAFSMLMIMLGHITTESNPVDTWMSSCKICIFYLISGFLIAHTNGLYKRKAPQFLKNLLIVLGWPYLTFSIVAIAAKCFFVFSKHNGMHAVAETFVRYLRDTVSLWGINSMWFLPTLFFGELIVFGLSRLPAFCRYIYAAVGLLGVKFANMITASSFFTSNPDGIMTDLTHTVNVLGKSMFAAWFLGLGYLIYLLYRKHDFFEGHMRTKLIAGLIFTLSNIYLSQINKGVDFNLMKLGEHPLLFVYGGIFGSMGIIMLLDVISQKASMEAFNYWGKNSMILLCTHTALGFRKIAYEGWSATAYMPGTVGLEYIIENLLVLLVLMLIMYGVIEFINKFMPFMVRYPGRKEKTGAVRS